MGIYDRDYYRDGDDGWGGNLSGRAVVWIIGITVGVFVLQLLTRNGRVGPDLISAWCALDPDAVRHGQVWRLATTFFISYPVSLISLAFSLFFLYFMGDMVEAVYGRREFFAFYLAAGLAGSLGAMAVYLASPNGGAAGQVVYGFAAPSAAVLVLAACHFPYRQILILFVIPVPIWLIAAGMVVLSLMGFAGSAGSLSAAGTLTAVAFAAVYYRQQFRISALFGGLPLRSRSPARLRIHPGSVEREPVTTPTTAGSYAAADPVGESPSPVDEHLEAKLDRVLEKVSRHGRDSLTTEENRLLLRASEVYKRRRGP